MITRSLIGTNLLIRQREKSSFNLDTVLLANFIKINKSDKLVVDIGTGNGALCLYMSLKTNNKIIGIEIEEDIASMASYNVNLNNLDKQITIVNKDVNEINDINRADVIISNPPFFKYNELRLSQNEQRNIQRHELNLTLEQLFYNAKRMLKETGTFYLIHRPDRLSEIIETAMLNKFAVKKIRMVHPYLNKEANHVLIKCVKNGKQGLRVLSPLILYEDKHKLSQELLNIYSDNNY